MDLEADAVAEAVAEVIAVAGVARSARGRRRPTSLPETPGRTASSAGGLGGEHELVDRARVLVRASPVANVRVQSEQ